MKIKKHIPNILSSLRLTSPIVLIPLITTGNYLLAVVSLCTFFITDAFDGYLARKWNATSELGAKIDAIADKTILGSLLIPLVIANPLMIINLIFEGLISFVNVYRKFKGGNPKTVQLGRIKMVVICLFVALSYLKVTGLLNIPMDVLNTFFALTTTLQIGALSKYINEGEKERKKLNDNKKEEEKENKDYEETIKKEQSLQKEDIINNSKLNELKMKKDNLIRLKEELLNMDLNQEEIKNKTKIKSKL